MANDGQMNTYRKRKSGSIVVLTIVSPSLACDMSWDDSEPYTYNDHLARVFEVKSKSSGWKSVRPKMRRTSGWSAKAIDDQTFIDVWLDQDTIQSTPSERALHFHVIEEI